MLLWWEVSKNKSMSLENFLTKLKAQQKDIEFSESMSVIEENYNFTPTSFTNGILKTSGHEAEVKTLPEINAILKEIGKPDNHLVKKEDFLNRVTTQLATANSSFKEIHEQYEKFYEKFSAIVKDTTKLKKLLLESVLSSTSQLLENKAYTTNECPVCLLDTV